MAIARCPEIYRFCLACTGFLVGFHSLNTKEIVRLNATQTIQLLSATVLTYAVIVWTVMQTPYPVHWDDGMYCLRAMDWATIVKDRGILRGVGRGLIYDLPGQYLPAVFITSLPGAMISGTARSMMLCQTAWFIVSQLSIYGIVRKLSSHWPAILAMFWSATITTYVLWSGQVLGEASLFGTLCLLLFLLTSWGETFDWKKALVVGLVLGIGVLTKQHFFVFGSPPVCMFVLWRFFSNRNGGTAFASHAFHLFLLIITPILVAGPWYYIHYKAVLAYAFQPTFLPHYIGESTLLQKLMAYGMVICHDTGVPFVVACVIGMAWSIGIQFFRTNAEGGRWQRFCPVLLLASGVTGFVAASSLGTPNPRFASPAELILGILAIVSFVKLWPQIGKVARSFLVLPFALQCVIGPAQLFGISLPLLLTGVELSGIYAPKDLAGTLQVVTALRDRMLPSSNVWIVGSADEMNSPLVEVMLREMGSRASVWALYGWDESEITLHEITTRIKGGDFLLCDRKAPTSSILMTKWDRELIETFQKGHEYDAISDGGREGATEVRFLLFQKQGMPISNSSHKP